ncbi:MAG TPA: lipoyl(octanoyl) transferase LipB [Candidatus Polarisedimenticolia bacterium]|nr:lipoyl(octanoyl) transferase LipB [Candidatus Polarisedimenticolia bacterium]
MKAESVEAAPSAHPAPAARRCEAAWLGRIGYHEALQLQRATARALKDAQFDGGSALERLLLLEHPPVITLGRNAHDTDVLAPRDRLAALGVTVETTDRGGQVTYHGPGQLVGYPILDLNPDRRDVARYLRDLEDALIRTLATYGIAASRLDGLTGVWVGDRKIAALGVHLSRWVTTHGFALNVTTDLDHFGLIVPCGITTRGVTSMARLLGRDVPLHEVAARFVPEFAAVFGRRVEWAA